MQFRPQVSFQVGYRLQTRGHLEESLFFHCPLNPSGCFETKKGLVTFLDYVHSNIYMLCMQLRLSRHAFVACATFSSPGLTAVQGAYPKHAHTSSFLFSFCHAVYGMFSLVHAMQMLHLRATPPGPLLFHHSVLQLPLHLARFLKGRHLTGVKSILLFEWLMNSLLSAGFSPLACLQPIPDGAGFCSNVCFYWSCTM